MTQIPELLVLQPGVRKVLQSCPKLRRGSPAFIISISLDAGCPGIWGKLGWSRRWSPEKDTDTSPQQPTLPAAGGIQTWKDRQCSSLHYSGNPFPGQFPSWAVLIPPSSVSQDRAWTPTAALIQMYQLLFLYRSTVNSSRTRSIFISQLHSIQLLKSHQKMFSVR